VACSYDAWTSGRLCRLSADDLDVRMAWTACHGAGEVLAAPQSAAAGRYAMPSAQRRIMGPEPPELLLQKARCRPRDVLPSEFEQTSLG